MLDSFHDCICRMGCIQCTTFFCILDSVNYLFAFEISYTGASFSQYDSQRDENEENSLQLPFSENSRGSIDDSISTLERRRSGG